jgi:hypothetical protein
MAIVPKPGLVARQKLSAYLAATLVGGAPELDPADSLILKTAMEGLEALDHGEIPPIFSPSKTTAKGSAPYRVKKYRAVALGFVDLLHARGSKKSDARETVGNAYCVSSDALVKWAKQLKLPKNKDVGKFRKQIADSTEWNAGEISRQLEIAANLHRIARKK